MKQKITDFFSGMKTLEVTEYLILALLAIVLTWSWKIAVKIFILLFAVVLVRIISTRHIGNPALGKLMRWAMFLMAGFYLWQGLSLLWTDDLAEGWGFMGVRMPLLALPLMLLCADTTYITPLRRRGILYAFTASLVVKYFYCVISSLVTTGGLKFDYGFDWVHHTYMVLYLLMALGFLYSEWVNHHKEMGGVMKAAICFSAVVILAYIVFVASRTGIIGIAIIFVAIVLHQIVRLHNVKAGLILLLGGILLGGVTYLVLPSSAKRITAAIENSRKTGNNDVRVDIYSCSLHAAIDNLPFGTGIGDEAAVLTEYYNANGHDWPNLNTHNSFLDAFLTLGLPGLLLMLVMLALPAVDGYRRQDLELMTLIFTIVICSLFESIFSRQMGLMFIAPMWYAIASSGRGLQKDSTDSR